MSLSARRAWIEILNCIKRLAMSVVALRKESVDRNHAPKYHRIPLRVALRKESVDRNVGIKTNRPVRHASLSARRAWIEMPWF